jgi:hypothetical protein
VPRCPRVSGQSAVVSSRSLVGWAPDLKVSENGDAIHGDRRTLRPGQLAALILRRRYSTLSGSLGMKTSNHCLPQEGAVIPVGEYPVDEVSPSLDVP